VFCRVEVTHFGMNLTHMVMFAKSEAFMLDVVDRYMHMNHSGLT
jgi:hypothetical protein